MSKPLSRATFLALGLTACPSPDPLVPFDPAEPGPITTQVSSSGTGAVRSSPRFRLAVSVGDPVTAHERRTDRFVLRVGVGSLAETP